MKHKELISALSDKMGLSKDKTSNLVDLLIAGITEDLQEGNSILIADLGTFSVKKKEERIIINPSTKQRMLVPPKLAVHFKPSSNLKEKLK
ncbi:HU family DNA-binding protein [Bacteroides sp. 214]|uniref:HU family DNA-binding protein n=1 Tax=Bacteroides sp. 214 TaxID=2302935 RepID=UPI0013D843EB|nr:HU family DNA-binding protein [Bacteroides sp. 214]